jgi:hypothetical protein
MPPPHPLAPLLDELRSAVRAPWESVAMTLRLHPPETLGDPQQEGSGAWHLRHAAETFRLHARHLASDAVVDAWPGPPAPSAGPAAAADALRADADRLLAWAHERLDPGAIITYGQDCTPAEMLGMMTRHIVWHAAAAHYWCCWKRPSA